MAFRRQVVLELGGFDEALGVGTPIPGGDENDLFWRLIRDGYEVRYEPSLVVHHMHRTDLGGMTRQLAGYHLGVVAWLTKVIRQSRGFERWLAVAFTGWRLVKPGLRLLKRGLGRDPLPMGVLLPMWKSSWQGLWSYPRSVREVRRIRCDSA
jgi:GT2 family glycosyltransferase